MEVLEQSDLRLLQIALDHDDGVYVARRIEVAQRERAL
jgi:hypothetical protein